MHFLTYVIIEREELTAEFDLDIHDIQSAVEEILMPYHGQKFDWYDIGGRWSGDFPNNRLTVKEYLALDAPELPAMLFTYDGDHYDIDEYIGLVRLNNWQYDGKEYKDIQAQVEAQILEVIKRSTPDDLIIIVDLHN